MPLLWGVFLSASFLLVFIYTYIIDQPFDLENHMTAQTTKPAEPRFSVIVTESVQKGIAKLAKDHKISQSEVIMTLYENADLEVLKPKFDAKREVKVSKRGTKSAVLAKISKLTPEQLEKLIASIPA